jgi:hypothetical protein
MIPRLTPKAAADIYGFSTGEALLKWCKRNDVPVDYLGRRALIPVASIAAAPSDHAAPRPARDAVDPSLLRSRYERRNDTA